VIRRRQNFRIEFRRDFSSVVSGIERRRVRVIPAESLRELILAFRVGSQISAPTLTRDLFNDRLNRMIAARCRECDRQALILIQSESSQGLNAARARKQESAGRHFATAHRLLETLPISEEAYLCAESSMCAQKAYFVYTRSRYEEAIRLIGRSFANDSRLERQFGFDILLMHRIQLLNNLMRIHAQRNKWREALALGAVVLRYLEDPTDSAIRSLEPPWNQGWSDTLDCIPIELVRATHAQIAREEVQVFHRVEDACKATQVSLDALSLFAPRGTATQIESWMNFQIIRLHPSRGDYLAAASSVLRRGRMPSDPLWRSVASHVTQMLRPGLCMQATAV
jgi:hypothetical protein